MISAERLHDISAWTLVALSGLLPFFFLPVQWITVPQAKVFLICFGLLLSLVCWIVASWQQGHMRLSVHPVSIAALVLVVAYFVSSIFTGFDSVSILGSGVMSDTLSIVVLGAALFFLISHVFTDRLRLITHALSALLFGSTLATAIQLMHIAFPSFTFGGAIAGAAGNAFGSLHEIALLAGLGVIVSTLLYPAIAHTRFMRIALSVTTVINIALLVSVYFFDVWVAIVCALLFALGLDVYRQGHMPRSLAYWKTHWCTISVFLLAIIFVAFGSSIANVIPERVRVTQAEVRPSWKGTFSIARESLANPLTSIFGTGPNTFDKQWGLHKPLDVNRTPFWDVSFVSGVSTVPTSLVTVGIVGFLAWAGFILAALYALVRTLIQRRERIIDALALSAAYLVLFHLFYAPGIALTLSMWLLLGIFTALSFTVGGAFRTYQIHFMQFNPYSLARTVGICALILASATGSLALLRVNISEALVNRAVVHYRGTSDFESASRSIARALSVYPRNDKAHVVAVQLGLLKLGELSRTQDAGAASGEMLRRTLEETIRHGLQAVEIDSADYQNWLSLASLYAQLVGANIEGAYENARAAYERARIENPTSPLPHLNLAQLEVLKGNTDAAITHLEQAIELKPDFAAAHYLASQAFASKNEWPRAIAAASTTALIASEDSQAWYNLGAIAYSAGNYSTARDALERAIAIQPQFANALYILGLSLDKGGERERALEVFQSLAALDPGERIVEQAITNLRAGKPAEGGASRKSRP